MGLRVKALQSSIDILIVLKTGLDRTVQPGTEQ